MIDPSRQGLPVDRELPPQVATLDPRRVDTGAAQRQYVVDDDGINCSPAPCPL